MFEMMAEHFVRQIKIARHYYVSQYGYIERTARKTIKRNQFGFMVDAYIYALAFDDMSLFETESGKNMLSYIKSAVKVEKNENSNGTYYNVAINRRRIDPEKNELNIERATIEYEKAMQMTSIHNNNALLSLLIRFENFLTEYFEWLAMKYPGKYLNEKSIRYSELLKYDFDSLKKELGQEAANSIMSQPLDEWIKIIKSHKFDITSLSSYLDKFAEIYYRRNIIVHNGGKVNRQYLTGTKQSESELHLGKKLLTDKSYITEAFEVSMIIVYGLLYSSLKANPEDINKYLNFLFSSGFEHMMENDWRVSAYIFEVLIKDADQDEITRALSQINYWISHKNMGHFDEIKVEIEGKDFSAMNASIRMAKEILLENYDDAVALLDEALLSGLTPDNVETWPLFIQFRKTQYYKEFQKKYAKQLEHQVIKEEDINETRDSDYDRDLKESFKEEN